MFRVVFLLIVATFLSACGGGKINELDVSVKTLTIFSDDAGVAKANVEGGGKLYVIMPNVVAEVAASPTAISVGPNNILEYPIVDRAYGYNIRQGAEGVYNVLIAEKIGSEAGTIIYMFNDFEDALTVAVPPLNGSPAGSHTYTGLYTVGQRGTGWAEQGDLTLKVNFGTQSFDITGISGDTTLDGSGFLENSTGSISSSSLMFHDVDWGFYSATTIGNLGGDNASDVGGVWYTNDSDGDPDFAGGYTGNR
jgi:hypothetical protein